MVGVGERDAADAVVTAEFDGSGHRCPCVEIAGTAAPIPALEGSELVEALGGCMDVDGTDADCVEETREALDPVRVNAVARGFGEEARAVLGAIGLEAGANENGGEGGREFSEGNAEHYWRGFRSSKVVGMSSATVG